MQRSDFQTKKKVNPLLFVAAGLSFLFFLTIVGTPKSSNYHFSKLLPDDYSNELYSKERMEEIHRRLEHGEKNWEKNVKLREEFFVAKGGVDKLYTLGEGGGTYSIWDIFNPSFNCPLYSERIGRLQDGGKWICGADSVKAYHPHAKNESVGLGAVMYSIGVERESSFEAEMLDRYPAIEIYGYDLSVDHWGPQISAETRYLEHAHFTKAGISAKDELHKSPPNYSLKTMMKMNGHDFIDIFKIDVEGGEWEILSAIVEDFPDGLPFGQMQIELHVNNPATTVATVNEWWKLLEAAGLRAFNFELNMPTTPLSGMYYAEYSFINIKSDRSPLLGIRAAREPLRNKLS